MASRTEEKQQKREEREQDEQGKARRKRRLKMVGAALAAALVLVVIAVVVSSSGGGEKGVTPASPAAPTAQGRNASNVTLNGIPENGLVLGEPKAPLVIHEFADLQCPVCGDFDLNVLPQIIERYVKTGKVRLVYENFPILGPDSVPAAEAAAAAALQNKAWPFIDLWYRNQGTENSGYVTDAFIRKIAKGVPGLDLARFERDRGSAAAKATVKASSAAGNARKFSGTPSFVLQKRSSQPQQIDAQEPTVTQLSGIVDGLLGSG